MRRKNPYLLGVAIAFAAFAFSSDAAAAVLVTTYDNISALSTALTRAALIFSDNSFTSTAYAFGYAGLAVGAIGVLTAMSQGRPVNPIAFVVPFILGAVIMSAIIAPKEDITVQDRVTNEIETVYAFPAPLANVLSWLTEARDAVIDLIDTSAPPGPPTVWLYRYNANGAAFDILMRALSISGSLPDQYLNASLDKYIDDCIPISLSNGHINWNDLNNNNVEFMTLLAAANHPSWPSGYFTAANPGGVWGTCKESWDYLQPKLNAAATQDMFKNAIFAACSDHGILTSLRSSSSSGGGTPADQRCQDLFAASVTAATGELNSPPWSVSAATAWRWMRQLYLGSRIHDWASSATPNGLANYYQILDRIGAAGQAAQWMPTVRAAMFGLAIAIVPFSFLFLLTGAGSRALLYPLGTLIFVLVWEIMDAFLHGFMMEQAFRVVADATQHQIGLMGLAKLGSSTTKMMTAFATIRVMSATLAVSFMYVVFRFGGMAMATMASSFAASSQAAGADAMRKTTDPIQHGQWLEALAQSDGTQFAAHGVGGYPNYAEAKKYGAASQAETNYRTASALGGAGPGAQRASAVTAGGQVGRVTGTERAAADMGMSPTQATAMAASGQATETTAKGIGTKVAMDQAAMVGGNPTADLATQSNFDASQKIGGGQQLREDTGGSPANVAKLGQSYGGYTITGKQVSEQMARGAAAAFGMSLGQFLSGEAGNRTVALGPEQMKNFLNNNPEVAKNMTPEVRDYLSTHGGQVQATIGSEGGRKAITGLRVSGGYGGDVNASSNFKGQQTSDHSVNYDNSVNAKTGQNTNNMNAANRPEVVQAANDKLYNDLAGALASGDKNAVTGAVMQILDALEQRQGVSTTASVQETGGTDLHAGADGQFSGSYSRSVRANIDAGGDGKASDGDKKVIGGRVTREMKGGGSGSVGMGYGGKDGRTEFGTTNAAGYRAQAAQIGTEILQNYQTSVNELHRDPDVSARQQFGVVIEQAEQWASDMANQAEQASLNQTGDLRTTSVGQDVRNGWNAAKKFGGQLTDEAAHLVGDAADKVEEWYEDWTK